MLGSLLGVTQPAAQVISPMAAPTTLGLVDRPALSPIRSWGYQLQGARPDQIARSPFDLVVVDYSRNGKDSGRFNRAEVALMQSREGGGRRLVLAYLSVGEAEDYRYYWKSDWVEAIKIVDEGKVVVPTQRGLAAPVSPGGSQLRLLRVPNLDAPLWLGRETDGWPGNFLVRYWRKGWRDIIFEGDDSYLSRIIAAGFDGVYLDRIDTYQVVAKGRPSGRSEMVALVADIAAKARQIRPGFLIVPQNGEELLADPVYLGAIDAVAKEDLFYGDLKDGSRNDGSIVERSLRWLAPAVNRGLPVLVVEYVQDTATQNVVADAIVKEGFVPYFGVRALDRLVFDDGSAPAAASAPSPAVASGVQDAKADAPAAVLLAPVVRPTARAGVSKGKGKTDRRRRPAAQ